MKKRLLSLALVMCMLFTVMPLSVVADDASSGKIGDNITWTLDSYGTLTLSGIGEMASTADANWNKNSVKKLVIGEGITSISDSAFVNFEMLTEIKLPDSLRKIGNKAFWGIGNIASVELPEGLEYIGDYAFRSSYIHAVNLPDTLKYLGDYSFYYCNQLTSVSIPCGVEHFGVYAFGSCHSLASVTLEEGIESIPSHAFDGCGFTDIKLPSSLKSIGENAFHVCRELKEITVPDGVETMGEYAFSGCSALKSVKIGTGIKSIPGYAFSSCPNLLSVEIPDSVTEICNNAFTACTYFAKITMPAKLRSIGTGAFMGTSLNTVELPDTVEYVGDGAFNSCYPLREVIYDGTFRYLGSDAFAFCEILGKARSSEDGTLYIGNWLVYVAETAEKIIIPEGTVGIAGDAFKNFYYYPDKPIKELHIPASLTEVDTGFGYIEDIYYYGTTEQWMDAGFIDYINLDTTTIHFMVEDGHVHDYSYATDTVDMTCYKDGYTRHICKCGASYVENVVPAHHDYGEWRKIAEATCAEKGVEKRFCNRCDAFEIREVKELSHSYVNGVCTVCGAKDYVQDNPFVDVKESSVYYDAILWAYYHTPEQITGGFDATHFVPNNPCTRAQVVTFLWRAAGCPAPASTNNPFVDVSPKQANGKDNPYYTAILWAAGEGITNGSDATHFSPNATVTRAQFVTFLWRYENEPASTGNIDIFADANQIATPFRQAVAWAVERGITNGTDATHFSPKAVCTRWAVVLFMYRDMK